MAHVTIKLFTKIESMEIKVLGGCEPQDEGNASKLSRIGRGRL
jgi:hypothetical protein